MIAKRNTVFTKHYIFPHNQLAFKGLQSNRCWALGQLPSPLGGCMLSILDWEPHQATVCAFNNSSSRKGPTSRKEREKVDVCPRPAKPLTVPVSVDFVCRVR